MKRKTILTFLLLIALVLLLLTGGSCDQTQLSGEVIVQDRIFVAGDYIPLQLLVPERLADIYRVYWEADPVKSGDLYFGDDLLEHFSADELIAHFGQAEIDFDRFALYHAREPGIIQFKVAGFYKQTNPQPITQFELEITSE